MSEQQAQKSKVPRGRSPSYPGIPLATAIDRAGRIYETVKQHPVPIKTITDAWGYKTPTTGPATVTYSALRKFGLLTDEGTGKDRVGKLTDLAIEILRGPAPLPATQRAALRPSIHREMWDRYGDDLPPEDVLRYELVDKRGFTDSGFEDFLREYRETIAFAQLADADTIAREIPESHEESDGEETGNLPAGGKGLESPRRMTTPGECAMQLPLPGGDVATLMTSRSLTEDEWSRLMTVLETMKPSFLVSPPD